MRNVSLKSDFGRLFVACLLGGMGLLFSNLSLSQHMLFHLLGAGQPIANFTSTSQTVAEGTGVWAEWSSNLSAWTKRRQIQVGGAGGAVTDFPLMIKLDSTRIDYAETQAAGQDLRFTDSTGALLSYQIEKWDEAGTSVAWVKVPTLSSYPSQTSIWMYYGNPVASDAQSTATWDANHRGVWHLGGDGNDATSNANNGTVTGAVSVVSQVGNGLSFSAAGDRVQLPDNMISNNSVATLEGWFKSSATDAPIFGWSSTAYPAAPGAGHVPSLYIGNDGKLRGQQYNGGVSPIATAGTVNDGAWHHAALVINSTTQSLYLDGQLVGTLGGSVSLYSPMKHYIGIAYTSGGWPATAGGWRTMNGSVDELRISTNARSADWIQASYLSGRDELAIFRSEETPTSGAAVITVQLNTPATTTVTIPYTVSGTATAGTDHSRASGNLTINGGSSTGSLNTYVLRDNLVEGSETAILTLGTPTGATLGPDTVHTVTITDEVLSPPDAIDNSYNLTTLSALTLPVLANDTDANNDSLMITAVSSPTAGTAVRVGQTILYTPSGDFPATDSFTYTISDGRGGSDTATVTLNYQIPFTWIGSGANANWTTAANWLGGVVPGAGNTVYFNNQCTTYCNPQIDGNVSVAGLRMNTSFSGTIAQNATNTVTIGTAGWLQRAGTFTGGDSAITVNSGTLVVTGGTFTSTSATLLFTTGALASDFTQVTLSAGATFASNSGTVQFNGNAVWGNLLVKITIDVPNNFAFNHLVFHQNAAKNDSQITYAPVSGRTIVVQGNLTHGASGYSSASGMSKLDGLWDLRGNLVVGSDAVGGIGNISLTGTAVQTISSHSTGLTCDLTVNKTGGSVTAASPVLRVRRFLLDQGTFNAPSGVIEAFGYKATGTSTVFRIATGATYVKGTSELKITADSNWSVSAIYEIDVPDLYQFGAVTLGQATAENNDNVQYRPIATRKIIAVGNLAFGTNAFVAGSAKMAVSGLWETQGNYSVGTENKGGTASVTLTGTSAQSVTIASGAVVPSGTLTVNKASGTAALTATASLSTAGQDLTVASGILNLAGFNLTVNDVLTIASGAKILCNGGTLTVGSSSISGELSCGTSLGITWTGLSGDGLWTTAGNWTNNTIPGASDIAYFNGSCTNCNATMNAAVSVKGIVMASTYTGTITQGAGNTVTVGTSGWLQAAGTFTGGNSDITVTTNFELSGGTFTSTSAVFILNRNLIVTGSPTFNHNSGTLRLYTTTSIGTTVTPGTVTYNHVDFNGYDTRYELGGATMTVAGDLQLRDRGGNPDLALLNNGTIAVSGNVTASLSGYIGTGTIRVAGNPSGQTISSTTTASRIPALVIQAGTNNVTLSGNVVAARDYTVTSVGTLTTTGSTLILSNVNGGSTRTYTTGTHLYNNVTFQGYDMISNLGGGTVNVGGLLTIADTGNCCYRTLNSGTINAYGDVSVSGNWQAGTAVVRVVGSTNQTVTGTATAGFSNFEIQSTGGVVTLAGTLKFIRNFTHLSGTVDAGTSTVNFEAWSGVSQTVTPGPIVFNSVLFTGYTGTTTISGSLDVGGALTISGTSSAPHYSINTGNILARGSVTVSNNGAVGTAVLKFAGSGNQTFSGVGTAYVPSVEVLSTGGTVTYSGTMQVQRDYIHNSGAVDASTATLRMNYGSGGARSFTPGATAFNNVELSGYTTVYTVTGTLTVNGSLTLNGYSSSPPPVYNGGAVVANGNVTFASNGIGGTVLLTLGGASSTTLTVGAGANRPTGTVTVAKTGGTSVTMAADVPFNAAGQDLTISSGTLDLGGYDLTIADALTVGAGTTLRCNGGAFTNGGTLTNSGTINCPGYSTYEFNWTGAGGDANWSTAGNWSGGVAPSASSVLVFNDTYCGANCSSTISASATVKGVKLESPYTGTVTQAAGAAVTVGTRGWVQAAGTFAGGDSAIANAGVFTLTGGTFVAPTSTVSVDKAFTVSGAGTFTAGTSTLQFTGGGTRTITPGAGSYNNVTFPSFASCSGYDLGGATFNVSGTLSLVASTWCGVAPPLDNGTIQAYGDIVISDGGVNGTAAVVVAGNASGQTITGTAGAHIPNLQILAGANNVTLSGTIDILTSYTVTSVGTLTTTGSTLRFMGTAVNTIIPGAHTYNNIVFPGLASCNSWTLSGGTLNVGGTLTVGGASWCGGPGRPLDNGTVRAYGPVDLSSAYVGGTADILVAGNAGGQTITGGATSRVSKLNFDTGSYAATLSGAVTATTSSNVATGAVSLLNSSSSFSAQALTLNGNTFTKNSGALTVGGVLAGTGSLFGGTVAP